MHNTYKTVLVPLDGSRRAEIILPHVESLAKTYSATVVLMHVIEPSFHLVEAMHQEDADAIQQEMEKFQIYLAEQQASLRKQGISSRTVLGHGPIVEQIIKTANQENADLIAMVSHGRTGLTRVFYGSVAVGILHRIDRPLLLIRSFNS